MKLLMLLVNHRGKVITRQQIIKEIWNDYGKPDEGLRQAVSFLRKIFVDTNKELFRTIPKKGYLLDTIISNSSTAESQGQPLDSKTHCKLTPVIVTSIVIATLIASIILLTSRNTSKAPIEPPGADIDKFYQYKEIKEALEQTERKDSEQ